MTRGLLITSLLTLSLALLLPACTEENAVYTPSDAGDDAPGADGALLGDAKHLGDAKKVGDAKQVGDAKPAICTPNAFVKCDSTKVLIKCNTAGTAEVKVDCSPALCDATLKRCSECDPASAPTCSGDTLVSCSANGLVVKTLCPNGCQSGKCVSCTPQTFFHDADKDGWGNNAAPVSACAKPAGYVTNGGDCDDLDVSAHPNQKAFFTFVTAGVGDFDYDCNKQEEQQYPSKGNCAWKGNNCVGDGWSGVIPACGQSGQFVDCEKQSGGGTSCAQTVTKKVQACR
jgi:hypothetical protein